MITFNDQSEWKQTGWNGFLVAQTTNKRDENENKNQPTKNHKITEK